jgi:hypothetical protein
MKAYNVPDMYSSGRQYKMPREDDVATDDPLGGYGSDSAIPEAPKQQVEAAPAPKAAAPAPAAQPAVKPAGPTVAPPPPPPPPTPPPPPAMTGGNVAPQPVQAPDLGGYGEDDFNDPNNVNGYMGRSAGMPGVGTAAANDMLRQEKDRIQGGDLAVSEPSIQTSPGTILTETTDMLGGYGSEPTLPPGSGYPIDTPETDPLGGYGSDAEPPMTAPQLGNYINPPDTAVPVPGIITEDADNFDPLGGYGEPAITGEANGGTWTNETALADSAQGDGDNVWNPELGTYIPRGMSTEQYKNNLAWANLDANAKSGWTGEIAANQDMPEGYTAGAERPLTDNEKLIQSQERESAALRALGQEMGIDPQNATVDDSARLRAAYAEQNPGTAWDNIQINQPARTDGNAVDPNSLSWSPEDAERMFPGSVPDPLGGYGEDDPTLPPGGGDPVEQPTTGTQPPTTQPPATGGTTTPPTQGGTTPSTGTQTPATGQTTTPTTQPASSWQATFEQGQKALDAAYERIRQDRYRQLDESMAARGLVGSSVEQDMRAQIDADIAAEKEQKSYESMRDLMGAEYQGRSLGLEEQRLSQQDRQFAASLAEQVASRLQQGSQFAASLKSQESQWAIQNAIAQRAQAYAEMSGDRDAAFRQAQADIENELNQRVFDLKKQGYTDEQAWKKIDDDFRKERAKEDDRRYEEWLAIEAGGETAPETREKETLNRITPEQRQQLEAYWNAANPGIPMPLNAEALITAIRGGKNGKIDTVAGANLYNYWMKLQNGA